MAAEAMQKELMAQLELDATDFEHMAKPDLSAEYSSFYLKEHRRQVELVVYEGVLRRGKRPKKGTYPQAGALMNLKRWIIGKYMASPFDTIVVK